MMLTPFDVKDMEISFARLLEKTQDYRNINDTILEFETWPLRLKLTRGGYNSLDEASKEIVNAHVQQVNNEGIVPEFQIMLPDGLPDKIDDNVARKFRELYIKIQKMSSHH